MTETFLMKNTVDTARKLNAIRDAGIKVALDDFGTGYSSLAYLQSLPIDKLKIDQSFLRNLQEPEGSLAVIQSNVRMAHSMNLSVVAEGVETRAELDLVLNVGSADWNEPDLDRKVSPPKDEAVGDEGDGLAVQ